MPDIAKLLRERLGPQAAKVPKRTAPDVVIRAMARFDPSIRAFVGDLGKRQWISSAKARSTLGWQTRPVGDSIEDTARSLL
jgi:dihydroflavonol-4-reductase